MDARGPNSPILEVSNFLTPTELLAAIDGDNNENTLREAPVVAEGASELIRVLSVARLWRAGFLVQGKQQ